MYSGSVESGSEIKLELVLKDKQKSEVEKGGRQVAHKKHYMKETGMKPHVLFLLFEHQRPTMTWVVVPISQLRLSVITLPLLLLISDVKQARILAF